MINVFQPTLGGEELARIKEVFDSNWIGKVNSSTSLRRNGLNTSVRLQIEC